MEVHELVIKIAKSMGARFSVHNRPMTAEEVFSPTGLLPAITRRADQLSSLCLGYGLGATFEETEGATLGVKVIFDNMTPNSLRALFITDVLHELTHTTAQGAITPLDQLMYD